MPVLDPLHEMVALQGVHQAGDVPGAHPAGARQFADAQTLVRGSTQPYENVERAGAEAAAGRSLRTQPVDGL